jgi:succinyl-diaminopimelate desuccinylase
MHAVARGLSADAAIVGEPTNLRPVVAHKGALRWRLITHGRAAHTSRPENGNNAIYQMVEVIDSLRERLEPVLAGVRHPLLTPPTLTVGRIEGGVGVNIVPERCTIEIDRRSLPTEDLDAILAEIDAVMARLMHARPDVRVEREAPFLAEQGLDTPPDAAVVIALQGACRAVLGPDAAVTPEGVPYGTDATHLNGIPSVVFGPGDIAQAHTADEWVDLAQVDAAAEILTHLTRSFTAGEW